MRNISKAAATAVVAATVGFGSVAFGASTSTTAVESTDASAALVAQVRSLIEGIRVLETQLRGYTNAALPAPSGGKFARDLFVGSEGADVRLLQELLSTDPAIYPERLVTGHYGLLTRAAVARLKSRHGLPSTGEVDGSTRTLLNGLMDAFAAGGAVPAGMLATDEAKAMRMVPSAGDPMRFEVERASASSTPADDAEDEQATSTGEVADQNANYSVDDREDETD